MMSTAVWLLSRRTGVAMLLILLPRSDESGHHAPGLLQEGGCVTRVMVTHLGACRPRRSGMAKARSGATGTRAQERYACRTRCPSSIADFAPVSPSLTVAQTEVAQFLAVCRRSKSVYMGTSRHPRCSPLRTRWALQWRGDGPLLGQCLRATKYDKLRDQNINPAVVAVTT